jgi:hypothetical protein
MAAADGTFKGIFFYFQLVVQGWSLYNIRIIKDRRASNDRKSKAGRRESNILLRLLAQPEKID